MKKAQPPMTEDTGFPAMQPVATLCSIAHLFGAKTSRCGIYLLEFQGGRQYIGQAVDVVRRFSQHRKNYDDIVGFSFLPTAPQRLDERERELIHQAEREGKVLLNTVHISEVAVETDLDLALARDRQADWLMSPAAFHERDLTSPIVLPAGHRERFADKFFKYCQQDLFAFSAALLSRYVRNCIPAPALTEYSCWAVSCLPGTNRECWPRFFSVNAAVMELFVLGWHIRKPKKIWGFVNVASDRLFSVFQDEKTFQKQFPMVEIRRSRYRDAGSHQISIHAHDESTLRTICEQDAILQAAAVLALRVMRKRATIYGKFHCPQLADHALDRPGRRRLPSSPSSPSM